MITKSIFTNVYIIVLQQDHLLYSLIKVKRHVVKECKNTAKIVSAKPDLAVRVRMKPVLTVTVSFYATEIWSFLPESKKAFRKKRQCAFGHPVKLCM